MFINKRYDNNIVPIPGSNSYMNGLYTLNDPTQQRITQPYQHNLLNQMHHAPPQQQHHSYGRDSAYGGVAAFLSPPRQPAPSSYHHHNQPLHQSYHHNQQAPQPGMNHHHHVVHPNESMLAFQQSRSRSLDANMYYDTNVANSYNPGKIIQKELLINKMFSEKDQMI